MLALPPSNVVCNHSFLSPLDEASKFFQVRNAFEVAHFPFHHHNQQMTVTNNQVLGSDCFLGIIGRKYHLFDISRPVHLEKSSFRYDEGVLTWRGVCFLVMKVPYPRKNFTQVTHFVECIFIHHLFLIHERLDVHFLAKAHASPRSRKVREDEMFDREFCKIFHKLHHLCHLL